MYIRVHVYHGLQRRWVSDAVFCAMIFHISGIVTDVYILNITNLHLRF